MILRQYATLAQRGRGIKRRNMLYPRSRFMAHFCPLRSVSRVEQMRYMQI